MKSGDKNNHVFSVVTAPLSHPGLLDRKHGVSAFRQSLRRGPSWNTAMLVMQEAGDGDVGGLRRAGVFERWDNPHQEPIARLRDAFGSRCLG